MPARRKFWGWGDEGSGFDAAEIDALGALLHAHLGVEPAPLAEPPRAADLRLRPPRVVPPAALASLCTEDPHERAAHSYGKSYRDLVRALRGEFPEPPDLVVLPESESDVAAVLDWCGSAGVAAIPYGGGSSVVGGVETAVGGEYRGVVSVDLRRLGRVLSVDARSRAAEVEGGTLGPALEQQLRPHGLPSGTTRSRSSTRRSAAGSRRGPPGTGRPGRRTSTSTSRRSSRSLRPGLSRRGGCPPAARDRRPSGSSAARRGRSA